MIMQDLVGWLSLLALIWHANYTAHKLLLEQADRLDSCSMQMRRVFFAVRKQNVFLEKERGTYLDIGMVCMI
jgi:hypothetical protein